MRTLISSIALVLSLVFATSASAGGKVGVIDYQELLREIPFQAIMAEKMRTGLEEDRKEVQALSKQIKDKQQAFDNKEKEGKWSDKEKESSKAELATLKKDLSTKQVEMRTKAMERQKGLQKEVQDEIQNIAKKVATEQGLKRVFRADSLIWDEEKVDLTKPVINHLTKVYNVTPDMKAKAQMPMGGHRGHMPR